MTGKMQLPLGTKYLQPPPGPPTLDATKTPLALLARTCSEIGKELTTRVAAKSPPTHNCMRKASLPVPSTSGNFAFAVSDTKSDSFKREKLSPPTIGRTSPGKMAQTHSNASKAQSLQERKKSHDSRKRKVGSGFVQETTERKISKTDSFSSSSPPSVWSNRTGASVESQSATPTSSPRSISKTSPPPLRKMSVCDPYCSGCPSFHTASGPTSLDGIKNCHLPFYPLNNAATAQQWYAQMLMAAASQSAPARTDAKPHVCHWVSSETGNCGKRFSTAQELLNHLQTHALASTENGTMNYFMNSLEKLSSAPYAAYMSQHAATLAAVSPTAGVLPRSSHSPLNQFNPYKANVFSQIPGLTPMPIAAGVGPYCSPFPFLGQRLSATSGEFLYP